MVGFGHNNGPEWIDKDEQADPGEEALKEAKRELEGLSVAELLKRGHEELIKELVARAKSGTITVQEMAVLRNILRDNGMIFGLQPDGIKPPPAQPIELPTLDPPEYAN